MNGYKLLIAAVSSFLHDEKITELKNLSQSDLKTLYRVSFNYDLVQIVYYALQKNGAINGNNNVPQFLEGYFRSVSRYENSEYDLNNIKNALNGAGVDYIPLKGAVIRKFYSEPFLRTSGDLDILIKKEDLIKADSVFKKELRFKFKGGTGHDKLYKTQSRGCVELHFTLNTSEKGGETALSDAWDYAEKTGSGSEYAFSPEFFRFYHVAHMAKHFGGGSLGIRPFIDLYILLRQNIDENILCDLLSKSNLSKFYDVVKKLCAVWFDGEEHDENTRKMESFVFGGGAFGSLELRMSVQKKVKGGRKRVILSRIFLPYSKLKNYYPSLEKHKWLLPFYEARRWFRLFSKKKRKIAFRDMSALKRISVEKGEELLIYCKTLGIDK